MATKSSSTPKTTPTPAPRVTTDNASSIPIIAMVLGITSLVTFTWFLGIPAIVLGIIGLKKYTENRGFSITGLITGIISTLLMFAAITFFLVLIIVGVLSSDSSDNSSPSDRYPQSELYNDRYYRGNQESF